MTTNSNDGALTTLLTSLQALFSRLSLLILNRRIGTYRRDGIVNKDSELLSTLYQILDSTPAVDNTEHRRNGEKGISAVEVVTEVAQYKIPANAEGVVEAAGTQFTDLSNRLHATHSKSSDATHLGEKLGISTKEHIRTALRYVREQNPELAKMHADLANEALQQAAHYLSDEAYIELKSSVLAEIRKLQVASVETGVTAQ